MPKITLEYSSFPDPTHLPVADRELLEAATKAVQKSYSPYSRFRVGAALRLANGEIVSAANTENAAYPMCICAEPNALAAAASLHPGIPATTMAITVRAPGRQLDRPASPCGSCRQIMSEYEGRYGQNLRLILRGEIGPVFVLESAGDLLPLGFGGELL